MGVTFTNNAQGNLTVVLLVGDLQLTLGAGEGNTFPALTGSDYFYLTMEDVSGNKEIIKCETRTAGSNILADLTRAQDNTIARQFEIGDVCEIRIPAVVLEEWETRIETNETNITSNDVDIAANAANIALIGTGVEDSGNKMYFYQSAAPTAGWVYDTGIEDVLLGVRDDSSGGLGYDVVGGNLGGTWTDTTHTHTGPSHTHPGPSHTHTGPSHTHTVAAHSHTIPKTGWGDVLGFTAGSLLVILTGGQGGVPTNTLPTGTQAQATSSAGGTGATSASGTAATSAGGTGATGIGSRPSTDRPRAAVGIICTKS